MSVGQPLTLDVNATRLEGSGDSDHLRDEYGINSPKASDRRKQGRGTPVGPGAEESARDRNKYGINSPRAADRRNKSKQSSQSSSAEAGGSIDQSHLTMTQRGGINGLVTQVDRAPDKQSENRQQVQTIEPMETEAQKSKQKPAEQKPSCWASLFCCCASPPPPEPRDNATQQASAQPSRDASPKVHPASSGGGLDSLVTQVPRETKQTRQPEAGTRPQEKQEVRKVEPELPPANDLDDEMPGVVHIDDQPEAEEDEISDTEPDPEGYLGPNMTGHRRCLVLDLDETLVHSSFKPPMMGEHTPDFIVPVTIDGVVHKVYVAKRPFCDEFLAECSKHWEVIIFTASLSKYADPLLDMLDKKSVITGRLFREHCVLHGGNYVKDLTKLGRKLKNTVIIDNAPKSYLFQPNNAVNCTSWFDDKRDTELLDCLPVLTTTLLDVADVRDILDANNKSFRWLCRQARQT